MVFLDKPDMPLVGPINIPSNTPLQTIFLAGTIDMGNSVDWQSNIYDLLKDDFISDNFAITVYNPRRSFIEDIYIDEQVNWEQDRLEDCDVIFMYITGKSKSPISLLEIGQFITSKKMIVVCEPEFYRYDNVRIMCERNDVPLLNDIDEGYNLLKSSLKFANVFKKAFKNGHVV